MVIYLERGADLHMSQMMPLPLTVSWFSKIQIGFMPLPLTVSCFSKIQIGFTFLVPAQLGSPEKGPLNICSVVVVETDTNRRTRTEAIASTRTSIASHG